MIRVNAENGNITISGHAGYSGYGTDIVCAAVSALVYSAQESIEKLTDDTVNFIFLQDEVIIEYSELSELGRALLKSLIIGLQLMEKEYPRNIETNVQA